MDRLFYLVKNSVMCNYEWVPLVNSPYLELDLKFALEFDFWFDLRHNKKIKLEVDQCDELTLWSIPSNKKEQFVASCQEVGIEIKEIDLKNFYNDYVQQKFAYQPTPQESIPKENMLSICCESVPKIICGTGTKQVFLEHRIDKKDNIEIYINSNEITGHNIPHCHVRYNDIQNYCVLSLIDFEKIEPDGNIKNAIICEAQKLLKNNIQKARKKWNEIKSLLKFKMINGQFSSECYKPS